jgi:LuxR family maltose regulon positive regulatory protein
VVSSDPRRFTQSRATLVPIPLYQWDDGIRRSKLRLPESPAHILGRPRLLTRIDEGQCPVTLLLAPAGFGKTTVATAWARQGPPAAWMTADGDDGSLTRFWAHLHAALARVTPGLGELVAASLAIPHRTSATELGRILADEFADHGERVRIVIDDMHQIPSGEVHDFLIGLLELAPPSLRLLLTSRVEPPLALDRFRLRGLVNDIQSEELLFSEDEVRAFAVKLPADAGDGFTDDDARIVRQQTGGWAAGLRLVSLRRSVDSRAAGTASTRPVLDHQLLAPLLEETMAGFDPPARLVFLRAALPEAFTPALVHALAGDTVASGVVQDVIRFVRSSGICRRSPLFGGDWLEFHPLFRSLLVQQLEQSEAPAGLAALHSRAAAWFAANAMYDAAIAHHLAAGDTAAAAALIRNQVQLALAREGWPSVARWLALLPREVVEADPQLLMALGWVLHFRGLPRQLADVLRKLATRLDDADIDPQVATSLRAEAMLMQYGSLVPFQIDAEGALAAVHQFAAQLTPTQVFATGIAHTGIGMGLHATGHTREGVAYLEGMLERAPSPIDAATIRLMIGLLWIHGQASHAAEIAAVAQAMFDIAERNGLRLSAGWARRFLGDACYEQDDLDGAMAHYTAIVQDHDFFHLAGVREALFCLALVYFVQGRVDDAWRALRRAREIMIGANALEHLALLEAYSAYLALLAGDHHRALAWARNHDPDIDVAPLFIGLHPTVIRATILIATGDEAELAGAIDTLDEFTVRCARGNYGASLARVHALLSVAAMKQGNTARAVEAMRTSLEGGIVRGFTRTYLDLLTLFAPQMRALATRGLFPPAIHAALTVERDDRADASTSAMAEILTEREREVLAALFQRLSYKEIAENLYISPATVKRHASSIYSKLGVSGRTEAIRAARELGWQA